MPTPTSVFAKFAGVVTYEDGSHQQFAGQIDPEGNVSVNSQPESAEAVSQVQTDQDWLEDMLTQLGNFSLTPDAPTLDKEVTSLVAELSGRVSYDDNSWGDFIVQFTNLVGVIPATPGSREHWENAATYSPTLANLVNLFEGVVGSGNVSITSLSASPSGTSGSPSAASPSPSLSPSPSPSAASPSISAASPSISPSPSPAP